VVATSTQKQAVSKYLPSMFDRLKKKQVFSATQKVSQTNSMPAQVLEEYMSNSGLVQPHQQQPKTQRNESKNSGGAVARSRSGGQRQGQDTRNSSCSSGANNSGSKKRKFSKIVFEISELPTVYAINRSLSMKRQKDQLNVLKGGYAGS
jgi:hypothetical protein